MLRALAGHVGESMPPGAKAALVSSLPHATSIYKKALVRRSLKLFLAESALALLSAVATEDVLLKCLNVVSFRFSDFYPKIWIEFSDEAALSGAVRSL